MKITFLVVILCCYIFPQDYLFAQTVELLQLQQKDGISFRGMSVPSDSIVWVSGNKGTIGITVDCGENWQWLEVEGYENLDFRSIHAFDKNEAFIANAGSPAYILRTSDGGETWEKVFEDIREQSFLNGISFWDTLNGIAFGDPIEGRLQLVRTTDGGKNWENISEQSDVSMKSGEVAFAASGTAMRLGSDGKIWIGTGGSQARLLFSYNYGANWNAYNVPIEQGEASQGIFSIAVYNDRQVIAVGGDYTNDRNNNNVIRMTSNGSVWSAPKTRLSGFKSSVDFINEEQVIATGTSGTDMSIDGGETWRFLSERSFNVVKASPNGEAVFLAGSQGDVCKIMLKE